MAQWEFPGSDPIDVEIGLVSGDVSVTAEPTDMITVSLQPQRPGHAGDETISGFHVDYREGRLEIIQPKRSGFIIRHSVNVRLAVKVPPGSRCAIETAAANVTCRGELGSLDVRNGSGDISAATVTGPVELRTASGDVHVDDARDGVTAQTGNGNIRLHRADGDVAAQTVSGDVAIGAAGRSVSARTASGNVRIVSVRTGQADVTTVSGDVYVGVPPGIGVYLDLSSLSGRVSSDLEPAGTVGEAELHIHGRTVSGNLQVARAALADAPR
jgi:DUF4097 and DUF4098 domain-containing protein YvlB